jgi:hypothetical protein
LDNTGLYGEKIVDESDSTLIDQIKILLNTLKPGEPGKSEAEKLHY